MSVPASVRRVGRADALVLTAFLWFLAKFLRYAFPPLFGPLQSLYGVSNATVGAAFTGFMLVYAAMQFPSGLLADRFGSVAVIAAGASTAAAGALALTVESPFPVLVAAMLVMGAGTGAHKTVAVRLLSRVYPTRTGRALGVLDTIGVFGGVAAPAAVVAVASVPAFAYLDAPWRALFLAAGIVGALAAVAFVARVPDRLPDDPDRPSSANAAGDEGIDPADEGGDSADGGIDLGRYVALFADRRFSTFVAVTVCYSFAYNGVVAFFPLYLTREAGLTATTSSLLYSLLFAVSLIQLVTGEGSDRVGPLPVLTVTLGLMASALVALVALTGTGDAVVLGALVVAVGLGAHGYRPVRGTYLTAILPDSVAGGGLGIVRTTLMSAGAIAPAIVGSLSETVGFRPAFWLLAAVITVAATLTLLLWATSSE